LGLGSRMPENTITADQLSNLTGLTDRRHRQLAKDGFFPPPSNGIYKLAPSIQGMFRYYRDLAKQKANGYMEEREMKLRAERQLAEIQLDKAKHKSLEARAVFRAWENIVLTVRQKLLGIAGKTSPTLAVMSTQQEIQAELEREIADVLIALAKPITYEERDEYESDEIQEADSEGAEPVQAAAETND
jgi:hypothetical protein